MKGRRLRLEDRMTRYAVVAGCWIWQGSKDTWGYGVLKVDGRMRQAHRVAWELLYGPTPRGLFVLHACDVPACINPNHLMIGTAAANTRDSIAKGRHVNPPPGGVATEGRTRITGATSRGSAIELWPPQTADGNAA